MLNAETGFGPLMFRYWSGHYTRGDNHSIVSDGVGNWFPLRTRSPAEIIHLTLRRLRPTLRKPQGKLRRILPGPRREAEEVAPALPSDRPSERRVG